MWRLFFDPEELSPVVGVIVIITIIINGILFGIHKCSPETLRQQNNIIKPDSTIVIKEKINTFDTLLNNNSLIILKRK